MSLQESIDFNFSGSKRTSSSLTNLAGFVNPQDTDKRYCNTHLGFMTPEPSPTDATPRRGSFALSENRDAYFSGSSSSSFMSRSGCGTPSQSTPGSSASNSRRPSMMPQEQQYYFSAISPSPSIRPQRPKKAAAVDQFHLQESSHGSYFASRDTASLITDSAAACTPGSELAMVVDGYTGEAPRQWPGYGPLGEASSLYESTAQPVKTDGSTSWSRDFVAEFHTIANQAPHPFEISQPLFGTTQPTIFERTVPQSDAEAYNITGNSSPNAPSLAPAFQCYPGKYDSGLVFGDDDMGSNAALGGRSCLAELLLMQSLDTSSHRSKRSRGSQLKKYISSPPSDDDLERAQAASPTIKGRNRRQKLSFSFCTSRDKTHVCQQCDYKCKRPEHLRRHEESKHLGLKTRMLKCKFDGCINPKTKKQREIISRHDNLKAHYTKTHFKYGNKEKGGKNKRKSMKTAHELGLSMFDARWAILLHKEEGKMNINHEIKDYLHVWKMMGYSIRETRDTRVKDLVPDRQGPDDERIQKYDARWKAMWDGTLTFEQALSVGEDMEESEAQGLLGVTMLETEEMGIRPLDPRWTEMDNGRMSVEQSEKLGVKERNPKWIDLVARRKARGWVEKFE